MTRQDYVDPRWQPTTFPTPRHERVHALLRRLISAGAADFFADACDMAQREPPLRSTTHLIAHLLREAEGEVLHVLAGLPGVPPEVQGRQDGREGNGHRKKVEAILVALDLAADPVATAWKEYAGGGRAWHREAHRARLRSARMPSDDFHARVDAFVDVLDVVLRAVEARYVTLLASIAPHLTASPPKKANLEAVERFLATGVTAIGHVFERIDASWLVPLRERNAFTEPPGVRFHEEGAFSFPSWPQADYFYRIAADVPDEVAATILSVPSVDNERVHLRFLHAATRMPPPVAARVAGHEAPWLEARQRWVSGLLPDAVAKLAVVLVDGGEVDAAITLLRAALALTPPDPERRWQGPTARFESWNYGRLVDDAIGALAAKAPQTTLDLLLDLIERAGASEAWSWRRRIDSGAHPGVDEPIDILFAQVRDLYLARAASGAAELRSAVNELEAKGARIYSRLAIHLLRVHGKAAPDLVVERATDRERLGAGDDDDDITLMVRDRFADLPPNDQARVIDALRENASFDNVRAEFEGRLDEDRIREISRHRLLKWLHALGDARPATVADEYAKLLAEFGPPQPADAGPMWGPKPPQRTSALLALSDDELLAYLRDWVADGNDPFEPSREGLAREVQKCAREQPERFARLARNFRGLAPPYVAHLLWGLHEVTKQRTEDPAKPVVLPPIDWASVVELLQWTAHRRTTSDDEDAPDNWTWARRMAVDLAEDAVAANVAGDETLARRAWVVIRDLMRDPDPTPERDAEHGDDPDTFAINTVRGQAIHAAIRVAQTLRKRSSAAPAASARSAPDAAETRPTARGPRWVAGQVKKWCTVVRRLLGRQRDPDPAEFTRDVHTEIARRADPKAEPSTPLRCILAMRFNAIFNIDRRLAADIAPRLFPTKADLSDTRRAAWRSFLLWNPPSGAVLDLLRESYAVAVDEVADADQKLAAELGDHLAWLGVRGAIDFTQPGNLLHAFVDRAPSAARHHALDDVGRALYRAEDPIPSDAVTRVERFWDWWATIVIARGDAGDLSAFGWWFTSKHLDVTWSVAALECVLAATGGQIDWEHEVLSKLAELAPGHPAVVARCLGGIIDSPDEWQVIRSTKEIRAALTSLLATPAAAEAREIASRLVARGSPEFQDLA